MIYLEIELRDTIRAVNIINDQFRQWIKDKTIIFTATNSLTIENEETAESILYELSDADIGFNTEKDCETCQGSGITEVFNCHNNSNECCGGCYEDYTCEDCNGYKKESYDY